MSLYSILAMYEADLEKLNMALEKLNVLISQVDSLNTATMDTIAVNEKPYKKNLIDKTNNHLIKARDYLSNTAIPELIKKIEDTKEEIARMEEEERRLKEEGLA